MGLGATLITFSPNTTILSSSVNSNFSNLNNAGTFTGTVSGGCTGSAGSVAAGSITAGTLPAGVSVPAGNISGSVSVAAGSITAGTLPAGVSVPAGNISGSVNNALSLVNSGGSQGAYVDGSSNFAVNNRVNYAVGSLSQVSGFTGTGSGIVSHGCNAVPNSFYLTYAGNFGNAPTQAAAWYSPTSSQVNIAAQLSYYWVAIAFVF